MSREFPKPRALLRSCAVLPASVRILQLHAGGGPRRSDSATTCGRSSSNWRSHGEPHEIDTLFFGGGTPTHLPPDAFEAIVRVGCPHGFRWQRDAEVSVEANPADLDEERLAATGCRAASTARASEGSRSTPAKLRVLERDHTPAQLRHAVEASLERFPSVSLDLIFGVPGETSAIWQQRPGAGASTRRRSTSRPMA